MSCNPLGSIWNKWDLHLHTPSSFDYDNNSLSNADIVDSLISNDIKVVAITDHHVIDVGRITDLQNIAKNDLVVLAGIELRSEYGTKPIHYIAIFPQSISLEHIWDRVKGTLGLTTEDIKSKGGDERVYIPMNDAYQLISELGGLISIHAGEKSNSIEGIRNRDQFQRRVKYDILSKYVDFMEIGQLKDIHRYKSIVFPATGITKPLIVGSDNHNIAEYGNSVDTWFKADPTFVGLRQVTNEPVDRVYLGEEPPAVRRVAQNGSNYVKSISMAAGTIVTTARKLTLVILTPMVSTT